MKTAISIPDHIFDLADELAQRLGLSRSELYSKAVQAFVEARAKEGVTEKLNELYGKQASVLDPILETLQVSSLERDGW